MVLKYPPPFIEAAHFTRVDIPRTVDLIVLHSMESPEKPGTARAVANWFADSARAPKASAHYCVDNAEVIQCVRDQDIAWHAPGANKNGIGIEHAGYASQAEVDWRDEYGAAMLRLSIELASQLCRAWSIPPTLLDPRAVRYGNRGITTHAAVSEAFALSDHTDPGKGFPAEWYVREVAATLRTA